MLTHEHIDGFADDVLLQHVGNGCEECFALLFHRYFRQVFALAFKILRERSEAEDILQEVFLAIFLFNANDLIPPRVLSKPGFCSLPISGRFCGAAIYAISGKWKLRIICLLLHGTKRFSELRRRLPGIHRGTLTYELRRLEADRIPWLLPRDAGSLAAWGLFGFRNGGAIVGAGNEFWRVRTHSRRKGPASLLRNLNQPKKLSLDGENADLPLYTLIGA
jgi:hypothetical protein